MPYHNMLSLEGRKNINDLELGVNINKISKYLNRCKSTISRKTKRGISKLCMNKALLLDNNIRNFVVDKLINSRCSPAAISIRIKSFSDLKL